MGLIAKDRIRAKLKEDATIVRVLLAHPMHTGRGKNEAGELIPAQYIQDIHCWRNEQEVLAIKCGTATSKNPYFSFELVGGQQGDKITIRWVDNVGAKGISETTVK